MFLLLCERQYFTRLIPRISASLSDDASRSIQVVNEDITLEGYQLYIVEQWVTDRSRYTKTVVVFTGDPSHKIKVCSVKLSNEHPAVFQKLFDRFEQDKMKQKQTDSGVIMVVNLTSLNPALNIIHVPDGDYDRHIQNLNLNINLRRLGCSGRSATSLKPPSEAQSEKFHQVFKTSSLIPIQTAVLELVRLLQTALLLLYDKAELEIEVDGLLCDQTMTGLKRFWQIWGTGEYDKSEASCDPNVVAALLSKVVSLRNKLSLVVKEVSKDPFSDFSGFRSNIAQFQKLRELKVTKYFDADTIMCINEIFVTKGERNQSGPKMKVLKHLNPTELNSFISETSDLDEFLRTVNTEKIKFLWKPKKKAVLGVDPFEPSGLAEGLIQGGKEFGKTLLKGVSVRTPRIDLSRDFGNSYAASSAASAGTSLAYGYEEGDTLQPLGTDGQSSPKGLRDVPRKRKSKKKRKSVMGVRRSRSGSSSSIDRKSFKRSESPHVPRQFFKLPELVTKGGGIDMRLKNRKSKKNKALLSNYPDDLDNIEEVEKQYHPSNLKYDRELENDEEDGAKNYLKNVARSLRPVESDEEDFTIPRKRRSSSVPNLQHSSLYVFKDTNGRPDQSDIPLNVENYPSLRRVNSSSYLQVSRWRQNAWMRRLMSELEEEGHTEIVRSVEEKMSVMVELLDKVETFSDELTIKLESFREIYESRYNDLKTLEEYINTLSQMQDTIKSRFDHSEVSQSRQLYKISNIEEKLVETEEITNTLKNKIQILREWIKEEEETGWTGIGGVLYKIGDFVCVQVVNIFTSFRSIPLGRRRSG